MREDRTRVMVEVGLAIALAVVLGRIKLYQMPMGGSLSLGMVPIFVVALRRGMGAGLLAGALYGMIDLMFDPAVVHPVQFLLDYPLAYGAIGLSALFAGMWRSAVLDGRMARAVWTIALPAVVVGSFERFVMHWISGLVFFGEYAPPGQSAGMYSLLYNGSFMVPSAVLCAIVVMILMPRLEKVSPPR